MEVTDLTPQELKKTRLPNSQLSAIHVCFRDRTSERLYRAVHVYDHPQEPYILLSSPGRDIEDFRRVIQTVSEVVDGRAKGQILPRGSNEEADISQIILIDTMPTQGVVAEFVKQYRKRFNDVSIPSVFFHDITVRTCENAGFPAERMFMKNWARSSG